jgi:FMN phosphatase YigB (HAD superfamily)
MSALWQDDFSLDPDAVSLLRALKRSRRLALVTNFDYPSHIHRVLKQYDIGKYFDAVVISGEEGINKPDPRIFEIALAQLGLSAQDTVHVGDSVVDYEGAVAAGITPIIVRRKGDAEALPQDLKEKALAAERFFQQKARDNELLFILSLVEVRAVIDR